MPHITKIKNIHDGFLKLYAFTIQDAEVTYQYEFLEKKEAVAVLAVDIQQQCFVFVKQWRPINRGTPVLECVAGNVEENETPVQCAIKEVYEEIGYRITEQDLSYFGKKMVSPGCMNEQFHLFIANVNFDGKEGIGGGVAMEHEKIEIVNMPIQATLEELDTINDLKTYLLLLLFKKMHG